MTDNRNIWLNIQRSQRFTLHLNSYGF